MHSGWKPLTCNRTHTKKNAHPALNSILVYRCYNMVVSMFLKTTTSTNPHNIFCSSSLFSPHTLPHTSPVPVDREQMKAGRVREWMRLWPLMCGGEEAPVHWNSSGSKRNEIQALICQGVCLLFPPSLRYVNMHEDLRGINSGGVHIATAFSISTEKDFNGLIMNRITSPAANYKFLKGTEKEEVTQRQS